MESGVHLIHRVGIVGKRLGLFVVGPLDEREERSLAFMISNSVNYLWVRELKEVDTKWGNGNKER